MKQKSRKELIEIISQLTEKLDAWESGATMQRSELKQDEAVISKSELRYRSLFESANDAIFLLSDGLFTGSNPKALEMFGCGSHDMLGRSPFDFSSRTQPDGSKSSVKATERIKEALNGNPQFFEWQFRKLDGTLFEAEVSLNSFEHASDVHLQAIVRDITERKLVEESNRKFSKIIETTTQFVVVTNITGTVLYVNPSYFAFSGFEEDEVVGKSMYSFAHKKNVKKLATVVVPNLLRKGHWKGDIVVATKDKQAVWVDLVCSLISDEKGKPEYFVAVFSDITERKNAEESIRRYSRLFQESLNEIYTVDAKSYKFIDVNQAALSSLGYSQKELSRLTLMDIYKNPETGSFKELTDPLKEKKKDKIVFHSNHQRKNGSLYPVEVHCQLATFQKKKMFTIFALDISQRKQAEEALKKLNEELTDLDNAKSEFIRIISHEIRTPLSGMLGSLSILKERQDGNDLSELLKILDMSVARLDRFSETALKIAALRMKNYELDRQAVNLEDLIDHSLYKLKEMFDNKGVKVNRTTYAKPLLLIGDMDLLELGLTNILVNAIKFSPRNSEIAIQSTKRGKLIACEISDHGPGFSEEALRKLFVLFSPGETYIDGNIGIDLALVKLIMDVHQGIIEVENSPDGGARVRLQFKEKE